MKKLVRGLIAVAVLAPIVAAGFFLAACGVEWFPKCDDPRHPCPPMPEPQPTPFGTPRDAGADARKDAP